MNDTAEKKPRWETPVLHRAEFNPAAVKPSNPGETGSVGNRKGPQS